MGPRLPPVDDYRSRLFRTCHGTRLQYVSLCLGYADCLPRVTVVRQILIAENKKLDQNEFGEMTVAERERIEEAARLEGLTLEEALERKKGFRYLY